MSLTSAHGFYGVATLRWYSRPDVPTWSIIHPESGWHFCFSADSDEDSLITQESDAVTKFFHLGFWNKFLNLQGRIRSRRFGLGRPVMLTERWE
jgi:hypothetical protein